MKTQRYLCIAVALCVVDRVVGKLTTRPNHAWGIVPTVDEDDQATAPIPVRLDDIATTTRLQIDNSESSTWDASNGFAITKSQPNEIDSKMLVGSRSGAPAYDPAPMPSGTKIWTRQEEPELIPTQNPNALPIEPKITPAIGIAGAIMLGTGVALCLIGIKRSWLHIFLSTGYLASLAVTVLIIYVMNPQHTDAIQGAYMVAAVVTGLIFGAVSLVFQEITEGLGCMLGSFCFAMWILVLAPGGVIHSTAGRGILIGVITVVGFGLSFSHYTRMYALLCCTSFAGATLTILGVDCFSRAGLKEFWLYLWSLNKKQFPLETNTYPITRGIRVEIACIIVVFLLGLVSQFKLWKVIKAHREKIEEDRKRAENEHLEAEAAIGRDIEANTTKERAEWEATYGEKRASRVHVDSYAGSSVDTIGKDQYSVKEREVESNELSDIMEHQPERHTEREEDPRSDEPCASSDASNGLVENDEGLSRTSHESCRRRDSRTTDLPEKDVESNGHDNDFAPGAPEVVPLPFRVPTEEESPEAEQDGRSEALEDTVDTAPIEQVRVPLQKLLLAKLNEQYATDALQTRVDQASSVAATADDIAMLDDVSPEEQSKRNSTVTQDPSDNNRLAPPHEENTDSRRTSVISEREMEVAVDEDDEEALPREPITILDTTTLAATAVSKDKLDRTINNRRLSEGTESRSHGSSDGHSGSASENLVEQLPPKLSKIALTYRTNEWAKHIADADHPENGTDLERPSSPGVQVDTNFPEETPKPVDVEALQQTNSTTEPVLPVHTASKASRKSHRKSRQSGPVNNLNRTSSTQSVTPVYSFGRSPSQMSINRQDSTSGSPAKMKLGSARKNSMPLTNQTLVESPVEEAAETFQHHDLTPAANAYANPSAGASASNLLDERNGMLQRRQTTTSFSGFKSTPTLGMMSGAIPEDQVHQPKESVAGFASPTQSSPTLPAHLASDQENMTLSQRRSLMQSTPAQATTPTHKPRPSIYSTLAYDSHQPARQTSTNSVQQSARLNQWRQTLQADVQAKQPAQVVESNARQNMMDGRRQSELRHARKKEEESRRQSAIDEAMRRGQLDGAHREAMRRMQAKATRDRA